MNGAAQNTTNASVYPELQLTVADDDQEVRYTYSIDSVTSGTPWVEARLRWEVSTGKFVSVDFYSNRAEIWKYDGSAWTMLAQDNGVASTTGTKYNVRVQIDGANFKVWRATAGGLETQVFSVATAPTYNGDRMRLLMSMNTVVSIDNVMVLADDVSSTTSFTVASNNELSTMGDYNGSNSFAYDAWGRMTSKTRSGVSATYEYGYGQKLTKVTSTYPDEGTVTYQYGGDEKLRREDITGGENNWYNYDQGMDVIDEEEGTTLGTGSLTRYYVPGFADSIGNSPASGTYGFYLRLGNGSLSSYYNSNKTELSSIHYAPRSEPEVLGYAAIGTSEPSARSKVEKASRGDMARSAPRGDYWDKVEIQGEFNFSTSRGAEEGEGGNTSVMITWGSYKDCDCDEAKFLQIADTRSIANFHTWHIDGGTWYKPQHRYRDYQIMTDAPYTVIGPGYQQFETCLICTQGEKARKNFGCIKWNVYTTGENNGSTLVRPANGKYRPIPPSRMYRYLTSQT